MLLFGSCTRMCTRREPSVDEMTSSDSCMSLMKRSMRRSGSPSLMYLPFSAAAAIFLPSRYETSPRSEPMSPAWYDWFSCSFRIARLSASHAVSVVRTARSPMLVISSQKRFWSVMFLMSTKRFEKPRLTALVTRSSCFPTPMSSIGLTSASYRRFMAASRDMLMAWARVSASTASASAS